MSCRPALALVVIAACHAAPRPTLDAPAIAQLVATADGVYELLGDGALVHRDAALHRIAQIATAPPIVAITAAEGALFAARADGTLTSIDPTTLALHDVGHTAGTPTWLARHGDELIVATTTDYRFALERVSLADRTSVVTPVPPRDRPGSPSVWLLDGDVVWFGIDGGEWGGAVGRVELATQTTTWLGYSDGIDSGVYGIETLADGALWIYGGMAHMGSTSGYVATIDAGAAVLHASVRWRGYNTRHEHPADPPRPQRPIVAFAARGDSLIVLGEHTLFAVSRDFATWTRLATIPARSTPGGRPDAMGNYPGITAMLVLPDGAIVIATRRDGLFVVRGTTLARVD